MRLLITLLFFHFFIAFSQPTPVETLIGHKKVYGFSLINKAFGDSTRFGFFSLTSFNGDYKNIENELVSSNQLSFSLSKNFKLAAGSSFNGLLDFFPVAGLQFTYFNPRLLIVLNPGFEFNHSVASNTFGILEWKPNINPKMKLYTRIQGLYIHNLSNPEHQRSFVHFRLGLAHKKWAYGLGLNSDFYGPKLYTVNNFGAFARFEFTK